MRVALSPLITDAPIILLSLLLFAALPPLFEQAVTVAGGLYVIYLGIDTDPQRPPRQPRCADRQPNSRSRRPMAGGVGQRF